MISTIKRDLEPWTFANQKMGKLPFPTLSPSKSLESRKPSITSWLDLKIVQQAQHMPTQKVLDPIPFFKSLFKVKVKPHLWEL